MANSDFVTNWVFATRGGEEVRKTINNLKSSTKELDETLNTINYDSISDMTAEINKSGSVFTKNIDSMIKSLEKFNKYKKKYDKLDTYNLERFSEDVVRNSRSTDFRKNLKNMGFSVNSKAGKSMIDEAKRLSKEGFTEGDISVFAEEYLTPLLKEMVDNSVKRIKEVVKIAEDDAFSNVKNVSKLAPESQKMVLQAQSKKIGTNAVKTMKAELKNRKQDTGGASVSGTSGAAGTSIPASIKTREVGVSYPAELVTPTIAAALESVTESLKRIANYEAEFAHWKDERYAGQVEVSRQNANIRQAQSSSVINKNNSQALRNQASYMEFLQSSDPLISSTGVVSDFSGLLNGGLKGGIVTALNGSLSERRRKAQERKQNKILAETDTFREWSNNNKGKSVSDFLKSGDIDSLNDAWGEFNDVIRKEPDKLKAIKNAGSMASMAIGGVAAVLIKLGEAAVNFSKEAIDAYEKIQSLQTQLGVVYGNQSQANSTFNSIEEYAKRSPFGVETMTQQAILLKQSGVYNKDLMDMISRLGDISSGNAEKFKSVSETYARILSSTTVTARDMKQLANAGVPVYKALVESMHKNGATMYSGDLNKSQTITTGSIRSYLQSGKVTSEDFTNMLKYLTDKGGTFYGSVEKGAKTIKARRQNLADAREMGFAALGENLASAFGIDEAHSFFGTWLSYKEQMFKELEVINKNVVLNRKQNNLEGQVEIIRTLQNMPPELRGILTSLTGNFTDENFQKTMSEFIANSENIYQNAISNMKTVFSEEEIENMRKITNYGWNILNHGFGGTGDAIDKQDPLYAQLKEYISGLSKNERKALRSNLNDVYHDYILPNGENTKDNKKYEEDMKKVEWQHNDRQLANALSNAFDQIDQNLSATTSTRNTRTQAKIKWDAGAFGSMIAGDEEFARLQEIKDKILGYWDTFIIETTDGMAKATLDATKFTNLEQYLDVEKTLIDSEEQLSLSVADLFVATGQAEGASEVIAQYGKQLKDFNTILQSDEAFNAIKGLEEYTELGKAISLMTQSAENIDEEKWKDILGIIENFTQAIKSNENLTAKQKDVVTDSLGYAGIDRTYSKENADKINARQVSLWHNLVANATGITATRVKQIGGKQSMNMYATNISQRNLFNNISRALLASGTQLGEISQQLKRTGIGNDGTQLFDWVTSIKNIEEMASKRSVATQQSLVDAYKAQIDVLEELEVGGVSTLDDWNELHSASAILGSAFSIAADKMADGSYRFTEATIQAAENMKREINGKLFKELNNLTIRQSTKSITDQNKNLALSNLMLSGKYNPYNKYLPTNRVENYTEVLSNMIQQDIESGFKGATENINNLDEATRSKVENLYKAVTGNDLYTKNVENIPLTQKKTYKEVSTDVLRYQSEYASLISDYWNQKAEDAYNSTDHWKRKYRNKNDALAEIKANQRSGESGRNISKQAREYAIRELEEKYGIKLGFDSNGNIKNFTKTVEVIAENGVKELVTYTSNLTDESLKDLFENYENMTQEEQKNLLGLFEAITATSSSFDAFGAALDKNTQLLNDNAWLLELREYTEKVSRFMSNVYGGPDFGNGPKTLKELDRTSPYYTAYNLSPVKNINSLMGWSENADLSKVFTFLAEEQVGQLNIERNSKYLAAVSDAVYEATKETGKQLMLNPSESSFTTALDSGSSLSYLLDNVKNNNSQFEFVEREDSEDLQILLSKYGVKTRDDLLQKTFNTGDLTSTDLDNIFSVLYEIKDIEQKRAEIYNKTYSETLSKAGFTDADSEEILSNFQSNQPLFDLIGKYVANNSEQFFKAFEGYSQVTIPKWGEIQTGDLLNNVLNEDGSVNADAVQGLLYALKEVSPDALNQIVEDANKFAVSSEIASQSWEELGSTMFNTLAGTALTGFATTLEKCGEITFNMANNLWDSAEAQHEMVKTLGAISSEMLSNLGTTAVNAGLNLIAGGALMGKDGAGRIAAGLGLVAAGGGASYLAGFINASLESDKNSDDELERLEKLKDNLADLLEQARNDAEYYETTLRNKSAISANDNLSNLTVTKVNDMILTDKGVFSTDPHDTIMAMKDPASLVGSTSVSPNVTFTIVNESGQQLDVTESKTATDENGNVAITAVINAVVKQGFMNGEYDDSITNMNMRKKGNTVYA